MMAITASTLWFLGTVARLPFCQFSAVLTIKLYRAKCI